MVPIRKALSTSVGKKYLMAISGLALLGFVIVHLVGNLSLYIGPTVFNGYAAKLKSLGPGLFVAEAGLIIFALIHAITAFTLQADKAKANATKYSVSQKTKGGNSHLTFASKGMFYTGLVILCFIIYHVCHFKFGVFDSPEVLKNVHAAVDTGACPENLYLRVQNAFQATNPHPYIYMVVMLFLGTHISHGAWSWIQSLGIMRPDWSKPLYKLSIVTGIVLAIGFLCIPIFFVATGGASADDVNQCAVQAQTSTAANVPPGALQVPQGGVQ